MKRKKTYKDKNTIAHQAVTSNDQVEVFTFGDPVAVLDRRELMDYIECQHNDKWYEPPLSWDGLARSFRAAVHHASPIYVKRNILVSSFIPHPLLSRSTFSRWVLDYLIFGNAYLERRTNLLGKVIALEPALAKYVRRGKDLQSYWFVQGWQNEHQFIQGAFFI